jgi:hypothetical protein
MCGLSCVPGGRGAGRRAERRGASREGSAAASWAGQERARGARRAQQNGAAGARTGCGPGARTGYGETGGNHKETREGGVRGPGLGWELGGAGRRSRPSRAAQSPSEAETTQRRSAVEQVLPRGTPRARGGRRQRAARGRRGPRRPRALIGRATPAAGWPRSRSPSGRPATAASPCCTAAPGGGLRGGVTGEGGAREKPCAAGGAARGGQKCGTRGRPGAHAAAPASASDAASCRISPPPGPHPRTSRVSVLNSKLGPSTTASTGHASCGGKCRRQAWRRVGGGGRRLRQLACWARCQDVARRPKRITP